MSGHNRWSKIKRKKEAIGSSKGKLYTKLIKEITVAARLGGGDTDGNARLRSAIDAAKAANMPADNITRAIKKGTGELEGVAYDEITYEGYGPGGVAIIVECMTDNRNRTAGDIRATLAKGGGHMGESGSVAWMFERRGVMTLAKADEDKLVEAALEVGALDVLNNGEDGFEIRTEAPQVHKIAEALQKLGYKIEGAKATYLPQNTVKLDEEKARKVLKLVEMLEDNDDVQEVFANFDVDEALLESLAG